MKRDGPKRNPLVVILAFSAFLCLWLILWGLVAGLGLEGWPARLASVVMALPLIAAPFIAVWTTVLNVAGRRTRIWTFVTVVVLGGLWLWARL